MVVTKPNVPLKGQSGCSETEENWIDLGLAT
jgi:hypothetical protein